MKLCLIITAVLCVRLSMGTTNNNYCKENPYPDITLNNFKAWDCSGDESQLSVDVNENEIPICIKGNFSIGSANPGPFTIVYAASVSGVVMGIVPVVQPVDICPEGPCYMMVTCPELKILLGAKDTGDPNCVVTTGDVDFLVSTSLEGPLTLPPIVMSGLKNTKVNTEIDIDVNIMQGLVIKWACILEEMPISLSGK